MKRSTQHYLFSFSLIAALLFDISGIFAESCAVESHSTCECCCCGIEDVSQARCCCSGESEATNVCNCCVSNDTPAVPPVRQNEEIHSDYQRTVAIKLELPREEGSLKCNDMEESLLSSLLCPTRRRAILCCWIT